MKDSPELAPEAERVARHWRMNLRLTAALLSIWFVISFVLVYFARELNAVVSGWPFSFWMAAQGALIVYIALVCAYSRVMNRIDHEFGLAEGE